MRLIIVVIILAAAFGGYYWYQQKRQEEEKLRIEQEARRRAEEARRRAEAEARQKQNGGVVRSNIGLKGGPGATIQKCRKCGGGGWVTETRHYELGREETIRVPCKYCNPKGL